MRWQQEKEAEFERLYGRAYPSEPEWEIMDHPQRARVMAAEAASVYNTDYRYVITVLVKFTDLTRAEALIFYFGLETRKAKELVQQLQQVGPVL